MKKLVLLAAFVALFTIACKSEAVSTNTTEPETMEEIRCMTKSARQQDLYEFLENCDQLTDEEKVIFYNELSKKSNVFVSIRKDNNGSEADSSDNARLNVKVQEISKYTGTAKFTRTH